MRRSVWAPGRGIDGFDATRVVSGIRSSNRSEQLRGGHSIRKFFGLSVAGNPWVTLAETAVTKAPSEVPAGALERPPHSEVFRRLWRLRCRGHQLRGERTLDAGSRRVTRYAHRRRTVRRPEVRRNRSFTATCSACPDYAFGATREAVRVGQQAIWRRGRDGSRLCWRAALSIGDDEINSTLRPLSSAGRFKIHRSWPTAAPWR